MNVASDLLLLGLGRIALDDQEIICANHNYLLVLTPIGALYMLFHTLTILVYSFVMYHIFFRLPLKHNLISYKKRGATEISTSDKLIVTGSMANQDAQLHSLIQID